MLFDYLNQFIIWTWVSNGRKEYTGAAWGQNSPPTDLSESSNPLFNLLQFWALVRPQLVNLSNMQNFTHHNLDKKITFLSLKKSQSNKDIKRFLFDKQTDNLPRVEIAQMSFCCDEEGILFEKFYVKLLYLYIFLYGKQLVYCTILKKLIVWQRQINIFDEKSETVWVSL